MALPSESIAWIRCAFTCGVLVLGLTSQATAASFVFWNPPFQYKFVAFESTLVINCSTNGTNVTTSLYHQRPGTPWKQITKDKPDVAISGDVYSIINIKIYDGGYYKCKATDGSGQTIEWPSGQGLVIANRQVVPEITIEPKHHVQLTQGESQNFTCKSFGKRITLTWYKVVNKQNIPLPIDKTVSLYDDATRTIRNVLMFKNAQPSDTCILRCVLTFGSKSKEKYGALTVYEKKSPIVTLSPVFLNVTNLESVKMECTIQSHPKPTIKWYQGNKEVTIPGCRLDPSFNRPCKGLKYYMEMKTISSFKEYKSILKILKAVYPDDQGMYRCEASNELGKDQGYSFINIERKPLIVQNPDVITKAKDTPATVECEIEKSNPTPTWTWEYQIQFCVKGSGVCNPREKEWKTLPLNDPKEPVQKITPPLGTPSNRSVVSVPGSVGDSFYRCIASNKYGSDNLTRTLYRTVNYEPIYIQKTDKPRVYTAGIKDIKISCNLMKQSVLYGGAVWYKDGKQISSKTDHRVTNIKRNSSKSDGLYVTYDFTLTNTTVNDTGLYTCKMGVFGRKSASVNVTVTGRVEPNITGLVSQEVKQGDVDYVELRCDTPHANPKPTLTWYRKGSKDSDEKMKIAENPYSLNSRADCESRKVGHFFLQGQPGNPLIICNPTHPDNTKWYMCVAENIEGSSTAYAKVNVLAKANIINKGKTKISVSLGKSFNISCRAEGNPKPEVTWSRAGSSEVLKRGEGMAILHLEDVQEKDLGNYICNATNYLTATALFRLSAKDDNVGYTKEKEKSISDGALIGIIVGCVVFVLALLVVCLCVYRRQKKQIEEYKELYFLRTGSSDYKIDPDRSLLDQCNDLPYDLDWEFPEERLILGKPLGAGAFGQVLRAEAIGMAAFKPRDKTPEAVKSRSKLRRSMRESKKKNEYTSMRTSKQTVAVKTLKEGATQNDYKDLASELKILIHLGEHKNIMNVLGACTRGRRLMVIIEFAPHGDLLSFLRERRDIYDPNWVKTSNNPDQEFTLVDLGMAAYQISRGMEFLASRKCVHRDLAARNILVGKDFVMKISDFGLARDIYKDDLYVKTTSGLLPVKWMAMESLFDRVYTEKSDVWSYGIMLWEIFTLGGNPYPGLPTEQLLDYLSEGQRMKQPQNCPLEMYAIMRDCWMQFPDQRPDFASIAERLGTILEKNVSEDNPYIRLEMDEQTGTTDYYLNPCDTFNTQGRQTVDGYEEALPTPRPAETSTKYDSPLPSLPPPDSPGYDRPTGPLPSIPPTYEEATKKGNRGKDYRNPSQSSNESGIGIDDKPDKGRDVEEREPLLVQLNNEPEFSHGRKEKSIESSV